MIDEFEGIPVTRSLQTNASLINEKWVHFFTERHIRVGVSIDGDADDNVHRVDRAGRSSFNRVLHGLHQLAEAGQEIAVIAVVSNPSPERARRLYHFMRELGVAWLGVNIEEREGVNQRRIVPSSVDVIGFWSELATAWRQAPVVRVREIDRITDYTRQVLFEKSERITSDEIDAMPTVAWNGDVTLISPELAGFHSHRLGSFSCGNILERTLAELITNGMQETWVKEFKGGVAACRRSCEYFDFCGGGHPANRYFEQGGLDGTETEYCRNSKIAFLEGVLASVNNSRRESSSTL